MDTVEDIVFKRDEAGVVSTNVTHRWKAHSATGFEFGYGGSGPADLALNILLKFGLSRERAWSLHQEFKWAFLVKVPKQGGLIKATEIEEWLKVAQREYSGPDIA